MSVIINNIICKYTRCVIKLGKLVTILKMTIKIRRKINKTSGFKPDRRYKYLYYNLKNLNMYVDTNNKTEYFI